ncbi:MAG TPA: DsbE family thiol:disulfide interchange protein [Rhodobacteraceae bacterium]|nr:DsbE family thiol:disulfide interchange protein [Paracoccaceae bacterium]
MILPPLLFAGLAAMFFWGMNRENPNELPYAREGQPAPVLELVRLGDEAPFGAEVLKAPGVKLVNYWASWCAPCRVEHPTLLGLQAEGIEIYGINYKDKPENALRFLDELGNPFKQIAADPKGKNALEWGLYGVPETYVIDSNGVVVLRFAGPITQRVLESTIRPAIENAR